MFGGAYSDLQLKAVSKKTSVLLFAGPDYYRANRQPE
jgi:hypothetical protein